MTGEWITQTIVSEVKKARFLTVLGDETWKAIDFLLSLVMKHVSSPRTVKNLAFFTFFYGRKKSPCKSVLCWKYQLQLIFPTQNR